MELPSCRVADGTTLRRQQYTQRELGCLFQCKACTRHGFQFKTISEYPGLTVNGGLTIRPVGDFVTGSEKPNSILSVSTGWIVMY